MMQQHTPESLGLHLLVAEDNPVNQRVTKKLLTKLGCTCDIVSDGHEAITQLMTTDYAMILMDCLMPALDGMAATQRIRALASPKATVPIIACTANTGTSDRQACLAAGMDDVIAKPITLEQMQTMLNKWHKRSHSA